MRIVARLGFRRRDIADRREQPPVVEPVHPFERRQLDGLEAVPWPAPVDDLGFVEAVDGLGQGIGVAIADATDRRLDAGLG